MQGANLFETRGLVFADFLKYPDTQIPSNAVNFIAGESGCGKSSMLKLFNATASPSAGEIFYLGQNLSEIPTLELRKRVLLVGQDAYLFPGTIGENITKFYTYRGAKEPAEFSRFLSMCCLELPPDYNCQQMSGGEKQRLFLAIMLSFRPQTLLLDEPTSALDNTTAHTVLENALAFCRQEKINTVIISHANEIIEKFAENVIVLSKGS